MATLTKTQYDATSHYRCDRRPDQDRMSNVMLQTATVAILLAHGAILLWAVLRRTMRPIIWLNLCVAAAGLLYWAPQIGRIVSSSDVQIMALAGFALPVQRCRWRL